MADPLIRRTPSTTVLSWLGALCLLSLIFWPTFGMAYTDRIVAIVNKEVITWFDLEDETRDEYSRLKAKFSGTELERRYIQKQREVLNDLIIERLQLQEAKSKGLSVTQDEIDATLRRTPLPATQTEEEFGQELLLKKLFDFSVRRNVVVEDEELRRYYDANPTLFQTPPQYHLQQILFEASKEDDLTRARTKAQAIYEDWLPETPLEDLADQHAQYVRDLGWVQEKDLLTPLEQALKEMTPGTLSRPIETPTGVHLLLYDDVKEPQPYPFEKVERELRAKLLKERGEEAYHEWVNKLKQQAFIDIKL